VILYLDASALVKRYVPEPGSSNVGAVIRQAGVVGTSLISRAEVAAALARLRRMSLIGAEDERVAIRTYRTDWQDIVRLPITEDVVARADALAWEQGLRGYDAVHLAAALMWSEALGSQITLATFDRDLWLAARRVGLLAWPDDLPALLEQWQAGKM